MTAKRKGSAPKRDFMQIAREVVEHAIGEHGGSGGLGRRQFRHSVP